MKIDYNVLDVTRQELDTDFIRRDMPEIDMTPSTVEVPKYLKEDLKALATRSGKLNMKQYLIDLVAKEKKKARL